MDDPLMGTNSLTIALPFQAIVVFTNHHRPIALIVYKFQYPDHVRTAASNVAKSLQLPPIL